MISFGVTVCWCLIRAAKFMVARCCGFILRLCATLFSRFCATLLDLRRVLRLSTGDIEVDFFGVAAQDAYVRVQFLATGTFLMPWISTPPWRPAHHLVEQRSSPTPEPASPGRTDSKRRARYFFEKLRTISGGRLFLGRGITQECGKTRHGAIGANGFRHRITPHHGCATEK
jgi:hypothetical protein